MKTDIRGFTTQVGRLSQDDLSKLLTEHKDFILTITANHEGRFVKGEGDAFWLTFPSVTAAALAASEIQEELRFAQSCKSDEARLAVRIVITLGDVLHQENDIFGAAVNLAARLETVTPSDEIYLSAGAWMALNRAEISTSFVNEFSFKGIHEPIQVYRVNLKHRTRIIEDQIIVFSDLTHYGRFTRSHGIDEVEEVLMFHEQIHAQTCDRFGGTVRMMIQDAYCMTFPEAEGAIAAIDVLITEWKAFAKRQGIPCLMSVGAHQGDIYLFRSYLYGQAFNDAARLEMLTRQILPNHGSGALISAAVKDSLVNTSWESRLRRIEQSDLEKKGVFQAMEMYELVVDASL